MFMWLDLLYFSESRTIEGAICSLGSFFINPVYQIGSSYDFIMLLKIRHLKLQLTNDASVNGFMTVCLKACLDTQQPLEAQEVLV